MAAWMSLLLFVVLMITVGCGLKASEDARQTEVAPTIDIPATVAAAIADHMDKAVATSESPSLSDVAATATAVPATPSPTPIFVPTPTLLSRSAASAVTVLPTPTLSARPTPATSSQTVASLHWYVDGVEEAEREAVEALYWANEWHQGIAGVEWVQDGLTGAEVEVIKSLNIITQGGQGPDWERDTERAAMQAMAVLEMPFLWSVSAIDARAAHALAMMSLSDQDLFQSVLEHPKLEPDGLTDKNAIWISMLRMAYIADANHEGEGRIEDVWNGNLTIIDKQVTLPISGTVTLTSVGIGKESILAPVKMAVLEQSVRNVEAVMARPFPTDWIVLALIEGAGSHFGSFIAIGPHASDQTYIHEVAHYYWNDSIGHSPWLAEGGAETMVELARGKDPVGGSRSCSYEGKPNEVQPTILGVEEAFDSSKRSLYRICAYTIGEDFFADLYAVLGERLFLERFRTLYDYTLERDQVSDSIDGCEFLAIWSADLGEGDQQAVQDVVIKWYGAGLKCRP